MSLIVSLWLLFGPARAGDLAQASQGRWYLYYSLRTEARLAVMKAVLTTPSPTLSALDARFGSTPEAVFAREALVEVLSDPGAPEVEEMRAFLDRANDSYFELTPETFTLHLCNLNTGAIDMRQERYELIESDEDHFVILVTKADALPERLTFYREENGLRFEDIGQLLRFPR